MGKEYLVEGAVLMCVNGGECGMLKIPAGHGYTSGGKKKANCTDCIACENIPYFGSCRKNEKDHQCEGFMKLADKWESMAVSVTKPEKVDGEDALTMDSILLCKKGGIIMPLTSGQGYGKGMDMEGFLKRYRNAIRWAAGKNLLCQVFGGDPINMNTGNFIYEKEDLVIFGITQLSFHLFYNSLEEDRGGCLGEGWHHNFELYIRKEEGGRRLSVCMGDGRELPYERTLGNLYVPVFGDGGVLKREDNGYRYSAPSGAPNGVTDGVPSGTEYFFGADGLLLERKDKNGNTDLFTHDGQGRLIKAEGANGGELRYHYNKEGKLICVQDHTGREARLWYRYGKLWKFINAAGQTYTYLYNENGKLESVETPRGIIGVKNTYDAAGRVVKQELPDGGVIEMKYDDETMRTYMKQQNGSMVIHESDGRFRNVKNIYEDGEEVFTYNDRNQKTSYVDKKGNRTRYRYDEKGNLSGIVNALGEVAEFHYNEKGQLLTAAIQGKIMRSNLYDSAGNLIKVTDALNRSKEIVYDKKGRPTQFTQPDGSFLKITYDDKGNVESVTDTYGVKTVYVYDALNRMIKSIDACGNAYAYQYDEMNRLISITDPIGNVKTYVYNQSGKPVKITDYDGESIFIEYNCINKPEKMIDKEGRETQYKYDRMGNVTEELSPTGAGANYYYDKNNRLWKVEIKSEDTIVTVITYEYDLVGNLVYMGQGDGSKVLREEGYEYDSLNRISVYTDTTGGKYCYSYGSFGHTNNIIDPAGNKRSFFYNDAGELTEEQDIRENRVKYTYNILGQLESVEDPIGRTIKNTYMKGGRLGGTQYLDGRILYYIYDELGRIKTKTDKNGCQVDYQYDSLGRMLKVSGSAGQEISYTYDIAGNITSITEADGNTTTYQYTKNGQLAMVIDAMGAITQYRYDKSGQCVSKIRYGKGIEEPQTVHYQRNAFGKVESMIDALGGEEHFGYDALGRVIYKIDKDGYRSDFSYGSNGKIKVIEYGDGRTVELEYTSLGKMSLVRDWLGVTKIERDTMGNPIRITNHNGRSVCYEWGILGERKSIIYPDGEKVKLLYDKNLRLKELIREKKGQEEFRICYRYDQENRLVEKQMPGGICTKWDYNILGQPKELVHSDKSGVLERYRYQYDAIGNKVEVVKERRGLHQDNGRYQYTYDVLNQLIKVDKDGKVLRRYTYDSFGNRIGMEDYQKGSKCVYTYNSLNQMLTEEIWEDISVTKKDIRNYAYDKRGNLVAEYRNGKQNCCYAYNAQNRLVNAWRQNGNKAEYHYNGLGQRMGRNGEEYLLDLTKSFDNLLEIQNQTNKQKQVFYWDTNVTAMEEDGGVPRYYLMDEMGSPVRVLHSTGKGEVSSYDEFGNDLQPHSLEKCDYPGCCSIERKSQPFGYTGYRYDDISRTYFAQAREYLPEMGRFAAEDTIKSGNNWYTYCVNNPISFIDKIGLESYVFYTTGEKSDFTKQAEWKMKQLEQKGEHVVMIPVASVDDFTNGWEAMGEENGKDVDIEYVEIYTHSNPNTLIFVNGTYTEAINISGKNSRGDNIPKVSDLPDKDINELNIYGCNAGNYLTYFYEGNNIAAEFSKKTQGGVTYAYDGNVAFGTPKWKFWKPNTGYVDRLSTSQKSFKEIRALYHSHVKPKGKLAFIGGEYMVYGYWNNTYITNGGCSVD